MTWKAYIPLSIVLLLFAGAAYFLLLSGRAPTGRPDLISLPEDAPPPPRGYPTLNAAYLAYSAGMVQTVNIDQEQVLPAKVGVRKAVPYVDDGDAARILDVYYPKQQPSAPAPMLLFIHGGGWSGGDRHDYTYYTTRFAEKGYVAATMSYRLSGIAKFPAAVEDAKCAVRWLRAHAAELGGDPDLIVTVGGSAGAHLAMMAGYTEEEQYRGGCAIDAEAKVAGVVDLYGPSDLNVIEARDRREVVNFLGKSYQEAPDLFKEVSPLEHLDAADPPTLVMHGTIDDIVGIQQSDALVERLRELGVTHWYDRLNGFPHTMDIVLPVNERTQWLIDAFVQRVVIPRVKQAQEKPGA